MLALLGGAAIAGSVPGLARAQGEPSEALVLRDPDNPVFGNPDGDITIVEWFDFNCPYCRKLEPELRQVVQDDGKVRLVMKDWPILGPVSVTASRMALACKYQGKYDKAHDAMIGVSSKLTEPRIYELSGGRRRRCRSRQEGPRHQRQGDRRHARAQQRNGRRAGFPAARRPLSSANSACRAC